MRIPESELILNEDGSIYHLNLLPDQIADTIITVGDPDRVHSITKHFDTIEHTVHKREFKTQTGTLNGKRLSVISTGIGTDNIDIVLNELDALVNIDLTTRTVKDNLTPLNIIRIGTSGAIQNTIAIDSFLVSQIGIGFDTLLHYYDSKHVQHLGFSKALSSHMQLPKEKSDPYVISCNPILLAQLDSDTLLKGVTATNVGFYAPQGRSLRLPLSNSKLMTRLQSFNFHNRSITNLEMETAGIYGLSSLLGHRAVSLNSILANRVTGEFSKTPNKTVAKLIEYTLDKLT